MSTPVTFARGITTGAELLGALQQRARELGVPLKDFVRPLSSNPHEFIRLISRSKSPTKLTFDRVEALLNGQPIPPPQRKARRQIEPSERQPDGPIPDQVNRDPCFLCGTRADIGCQHQVPEP